MTDLKDQLRVLGLRHTAETLDDLVALATKSRWGAHQLFEHVARTEAEDRARRSLERRLGRSKLGAFKPMTDFDWAWPKRIDREAVAKFDKTGGLYGTSQSTNPADDATNHARQLDFARQSRRRLCHRAVFYERDERACPFHSRASKH